MSTEPVEEVGAEAPSAVDAPLPSGVDDDEDDHEHFADELMDEADLFADLEEHLDEGEYDDTGDEE